MKAEYVTSTIGKGTELHISAAEYKRINSEEGWSDNPNMAMDSNGDLMLRMGNHMAMDMDTGDIHVISLWPDDDE